MVIAAMSHEMKNQRFFLLHVAKDFTG